MIADKMKNMVANSSAIRAMFEEGTRLAGIYGRENVFDFSLGNPIRSAGGISIRNLFCTSLRMSNAAKPLP